VPFSLLQSCSPANIATFMVLLSLSAILAFVGTTSGAMRRKSKPPRFVQPAYSLYCSADHLNIWGNI
jgi:hypothetical protein